MFTGLVRTVGVVQRVAERGHSDSQSRSLQIASDLPPADLALGASVCCSGICLTVVETGPGWFAVDAAFETLACTTLQAWRVGTRINLEPSLRVGDALGGHFVSGHVDTAARLRHSDSRGPARELWFDVAPSWLRLCAPKGSVCLDGVSLTINRVDEHGFMVAIVPHTLQVTTLGELEVGGLVNMEADMLARYVARLLPAGQGDPHPGELP